MTTESTARGQPMTISDVLASHDAGTLASLPDASLLSIQTSIDATVTGVNKWAADFRESLQDKQDVDVEAYLEPSLTIVAKLAEISHFITRTTTARYGCSD